MSKIRTGIPSTKEMWGEAEIMNYLKCNEDMAKKVLEDYHRENGGGYGPVDMALILDYIERKQRDEREREARYKSDLANVETAAALKEQVKALKEQIAVLRESAIATDNDARKARLASHIANVIAVASFIVALIALLLKVN